MAVEYTAKGIRVRKTFPDAFSAKRFYVLKFKAGADPKVKRIEGDPTMAKTTKTETTTSKNGTATREIKWTSEGKQALMAAMLKLGATSAGKAVSREDIQKAAGNVAIYSQISSLHWDIFVQGYVATALAGTVVEGERGYYYYLTAKGVGQAKRMAKGTAKEPTKASCKA
jgi:hypothetical protein